MNEPDGLSLAEAAAWYASHGLAVFPCRPGAKEPLLAGGFHAATTQLEQIRRWWRRWPEANIGLATGCVNNLVVLDIDPRNGGDETLEAWIARYGRWPETAEAVTGGGGRHVIFRYVTGLKCGPIAPGVDLKTDGGYIIVAPSVHPSGNPYRWDGLEGAEALARLAAPPGWLLRLTTERRSRPPTATGDRMIPEGRRNDTLFRLACGLRARGLSEAAMRAALVEENRARCCPPLPDEEVAAIAQSAARYEVEPRQSWGIDFTVPDSPSEALAVLNALGLWRGLRWRAWRRRGDWIIGQTESGAEVRIPARRLLIFDACAAEVLAATGVAILRPRKGLVRAQWAAVAELIHRAASEDVVLTARPEAELRADLIRCWELAGAPAPADPDELFALLSALRFYVRRPQEATAPPAVFLWEDYWHVKLDTFRLWLSTPPATARFQTIDQLEQSAALLGFRPHPEQLQVQREGERVRVRTWSAPRAVFEEPDSVNRSVPTEGAKVTR